MTRLGALHDPEARRRHHSPKSAFIYFSSHSPRARFDEFTAGFDTFVLTCRSTNKVGTGPVEASPEPDEGGQRRPPRFTRLTRTYT